MSIWRLNVPGRALIGLWHRFHIWRAQRKYARVVALRMEAERLFAKANELMRRHAENPQGRLPLGDD